MGICASKATSRAKDELADVDDDDDAPEAGSSPGQYGVDQQIALDAHNALRALHGAPPLVWDDTCAQHALLAVQECVNQGALMHNNCSEYNEGQNLYTASSTGDNSANSKTAVQSWYSELDSYDFGNPGFGMDTGHFTQLVWKGTTKVGMAKVVTEDGGWNTCYIAANYSAAGNMTGDFEANVLPEE